MKKEPPQLATIFHDRVATSSALEIARSGEGTRAGILAPERFDLFVREDRERARVAHRITSAHSPLYPGDPRSTL